MHPSPAYQLIFSTAHLSTLSVPSTTLLPLLACSPFLFTQMTHPLSALSRTSAEGSRSNLSNSVRDTRAVPCLILLLAPSLTVDKSLEAQNLSVPFPRMGPALAALS